MYSEINSKENQSHKSATFSVKKETFFILKSSGFQVNCICNFKAASNIFVSETYYNFYAITNNCWAIELENFVAF